MRNEDLNKEEGDKLFNVTKETFDKLIQDCSYESEYSINLRILNVLSCCLTRMMANVPIEGRDSFIKLLTLNLEENKKNLKEQGF